jgi:hypothetical protein
MTTIAHDNGKPTLMQCMAAAVDLHREYQAGRRHAQTAAGASSSTSPSPDSPSHADATSEPPNRLRKIAQPGHADHTDFNTHGGPAAHTILKRYNSETDIMSTTDDCERLIEKAFAASERGDITTACDLLDKAKRDLNQQLSDLEEIGQDDDGEPDDDDEDASNPSLEKAADSGMAFDHRNMGPVAVDHEHQATTHRTGLWPSTQQPDRHKFHSRIEFVQQRDGVNRSTAMGRARLEYSADYENFQRWQSGTTAQQQQSDRSVKRAAPETFEDLVSAEIRKGVNMEVAGQRVLQRYGSQALRNRFLLAKGASEISERFEKRLDAIQARDLCSRTDAQRTLRKEDPRLFSTLQATG